MLSSGRVAQVEMTVQLPVQGPALVPAASLSQVMPATVLLKIVPKQAAPISVLGLRGSHGSFLRDAMSNPSRAAPVPPCRKQKPPPAEGFLILGCLAVAPTQKDI